MLPDAHTGCARLAGRSFWPLIIDSTAHRCAPLFEVGDLSSEKSDAGVGGRQVWEQTGEPRFAGPLSCKD